MRKDKVNGDHDGSGISFLLDPIGGVQVFQSAVSDTEGSKVVHERVQIANYSEDVRIIHFK